jgi:SAM-dependent methyltransferase
MPFGCSNAYYLIRFELAPSNLPSKMFNPPRSPAADRNKQPILDALARIVGEQGTVLEIASGTGQHAAWFAASMPQWIWQPTDADPRTLPALAARVAEAALPNLRPPLLLDVMSPQWPSQGPAFAEGGKGGEGEAEKFDAIYCANMLHIAPWPTCAALMQGAARHLRAGGLLITYGPYIEDDVPTAPSNTAFDEDLRARNAAWGIRRLEDVAAEARRAGLALRERHAMPANNLLLVFGLQ